VSDEQVKGIQRYDFRRCKLHFDPHVCLCGKQARPEGEFVTFADHEQALAALEARNRELEGVIYDANATLCECRGANREGCNCDVHAAHRILRAALKGAS